MSQILLSEDQLVASLCRKSFYFFLQEFWEVVIKEKPIWNWHIEYICDECQYMVEDIIAGLPKEHDLLINLPPGETKSTIISVMLPIWAWTKLASFKTIVTTHTYNPLGLDLSRKSRDIVRSEKFQRLFPEVSQLKEDQDTKGYFINQEGGFRLVSTVGGVSPIGLHAHLLIVDDPIDPKSARLMSGKQLREVNEWVDQDLSSRKIDKEVSATIMLMQRLNENDPSGFWLRTAAAGKGPKIKHICLPADLNEGYPVYPEELEEYYEDGLLDPKRLPRRVLKEYKDKGEYIYAAQYGEQPVPPTGGMFKVDKLKIETPPKDDQFRIIARFWDKASSEGKGDYTAGIKIGIHRKDGSVWVLHAERGQLDVEVRENTIKRTAQSDGRKVRIGQEREGGSGGKESARATAKRLKGYSVMEIIASSRGSKIAWAEPFATQVNIENVWLAEGDWNQDYIDELKLFPHGSYDDQVDGSSGAFQICSEYESDLEEWIDHAF